MSNLKKAASIGMMLLSGNLFAQQFQAPLTIRINPEIAVGGEASKFIEEVEFIPLETGKNSPISNIVQVEIIPIGFVILDKGSNSIRIFSKEGEQIGIVKPNFIINLFTLNVFNNTIEIYNYPTMFVYNLRGVLLRTEKQPDVPKNSFGVIKHQLSPKQALFYNTLIKNEKDSLIYELMRFQGNSIIESYFPFAASKKIDYIDEMGLVNFRKTVYHADTANYYIHNYDYTVYRIKKDGLTPAYKFLFPSEISLPADFQKKTMEEKVQFLKKDKSSIMRLFSFYKVGECLYFDTGHEGYIYDLNSQKLVNISLIKGDLISNYFPINGREAGIGRSAVLNFYNESFYFSMPSTLLYDALKTKKTSTDPNSTRLEKYFKNQTNRDSRPILVRVRFKNKF